MIIFAKYIIKIILKKIHYENFTGYSQRLQQT